MSLSMMPMERKCRVKLLRFQSKREIEQEIAMHAESVEADRLEQEKLYEQIVQEEIFCFPSMFDLEEEELYSSFDSCCCNTCRPSYEW